MRVKTLKLNENTEIPIIGFGTWQLQGEQAERSVAYALEVGYRHIDTASRYGNHQEVGKVIKESGLSRSEIFITTKLWRDNFHHDNAISEFEQSLAELQLEYVDLYLIHWPNKEVPVGETLEALAKLKEQGKIKAIGVSNFTIKHLQEALRTGVEITNNQVEFHPSLNQKQLKDFCDEHNITLTAYSPIAQGKDLTLPEIKQLAEKYNAGPAQIILAWLIAKNIVVIPRSANPEHIKNNFDSVNLLLETEDITLIDSIGGNNRINMPHYHEFEN